MKRVLFVIFGGTGDLARRKLLPALSKLQSDREHPIDLSIIALARRNHTSASYLQDMEQSATASFDLSILKDRITYFRMDATDERAYPDLKRKVDEIADRTDLCLYYLALSPELFTEAATNLSAVKLIEKGNRQKRVLFEKPFGTDLKSAIRINQGLASVLDEEQIYRIDHYLGKEMIQNLMMVRFGNRIFEDSWNNSSIRSIHIVSKEKDGILGRGAYYDQAGALKDMVQSHLLQMLSLVAMDVPLSYHSEDVKNEKVAVLDNLSFDPNGCYFGQYAGYREEKNVGKDSLTETFVRLKAFVDTPRFKGIPIYLLTGKKLSRKETYIMVEFEVTSEQRKWKLPLRTNKLYIRIAPLDGVGLALNSKVIGRRDEVEEVELDYCASCKAFGNVPEAYERLLRDAIDGHKTLFARWDEIEKSWRHIEAIKAKQKEPFTYKDDNELERIMKEEKEVVL
ncbi:MAG: glucose-6-phosphate dehydrogenase [Acholeplasmataceae bacterium]